MIFKDRDFLITKEGLIFRVYGYTHPPDAAVCDVEYAPETIYQTSDPRAIRFLYRGHSDDTKQHSRYYKFYFDGGLKFVQKRYPEYQVNFRPLNVKLVGLKETQITEFRSPQEKLRSILANDEKDPLIQTTQDIIDIITDHSTLKPNDFGCFGSILHDFYHVKYSDIDLTCHGKKELRELRETLNDFYVQDEHPIKNEFDFWTKDIEESKHWHFVNYPIKDYPLYERRKAIYAVTNSPLLNRRIKIEFEPIKKESEFKNEYENLQNIEHVGWIEVVAEITDDDDAFYLQSLYSIKILKIERGPRVEIDRVCNFLEEYRGIVQRGETVVIKGNLEKVTTVSGIFYQITLSYGHRNYEKQVLKLKSPTNLAD
ncbi:MAG: hypothetical protein ACTSRW_02685 [Candidatus Helarchaeota archaeon]